jgi:hypothetical protein
MRAASQLTACWRQPLPFGRSAPDDVAQLLKVHHVGGSAVAGGHGAGSDAVHLAGQRRRNINVGGASAARCSAAAPPHAAGSGSPREPPGASATIADPLIGRVLRRGRGWGPRDARRWAPKTRPPRPGRPPPTPIGCPVSTCLGACALAVRAAAGWARMGRESCIGYD